MLYQKKPKQKTKKTPENPMFNPRSLKVSPVLLSKIFVDLVFVFRPVIHFELILY